MSLTVTPLEESGTKGARTRQAILDAAIARFGREGFRATSVADITRDAGVGGTVAYTYFPNKEALFLAAVDEDAAALIQMGLTFLDAQAGPDWRQPLLFAVAASVADHPLARRLLAGLEPEVTGRVLTIPALNDLRAACAQRLRDEQARTGGRHHRPPLRRRRRGGVSRRPGPTRNLTSRKHGQAEIHLTTGTRTWSHAVAPFEALTTPVPTRRVR